MEFTEKYKWAKQKKIAVFLIIFMASLLIFEGFCITKKAQAKPAPVKMIPEDFSSIAKKVSPSVVNIRAEKSAKVTERLPHYFNRNPGLNDPFHDFFEKFFGDQSPRKKFRRQQSVGSGFIISETGFIVTNNHVVEGADNITVIMADQKEFKAKIIGRDKNTDIALLKINSGKKLNNITFGNSEDLKVGQWVVAIGSPFGLEYTVTAGIISAKGRVIGSGPYDDFLQTDASINPGNSGGPLLNMYGQVIGINTAIIPSAQGIGFAIPSNLANGIIKQLMDHGEVTRGWLGVGIQSLSKEIAQYYGIQDGNGALITEVFPNNPADHAGIKPKDIILSINGRKVKNSRDLTKIIADSDVGKTVKIKILRKGKEKNFSVKLTKRDEVLVSSDYSPKGGEDKLGLSVSDITPEIANRFGIKEPEEGIIVIRVTPNSKAEKAGLLPGDLIKEINQSDIKAISDYIKIVKKVKKGNPIYMYVSRKSKGFLIIKIVK